MATLTEMVAAVVVHSSAAAFSHFGVTFDLPQFEQRNPAAERVVARTPRQAAKPARVEAVKVEKASICPEKARLIRA
jgi:hypothetical protein